MSTTPRVAIEIKALNKWYGGHHVLKDINLSVNHGEPIVICGPSGCGKSTLIRCMNRLEKYHAGSLQVAGVLLGEDTRGIEEIRKEVGMVFQEFNLFPHLTILENCTLAPKMVRQNSQKHAEEIAMQVLEQVHIQDQAHQYPEQNIFLRKF